MATRYPAADAFEHDAAEVLLDMEVEPDDAGTWRGDR